MREPSILLELLGGFDEGRSWCVRLNGRRGRRRHGSPEAQVAGAIVGPVEQVLHLLNIRFGALQLGLDDASAPRIRAGVPHGTGDALELRELLRARRQGQVEGVQGDHLGPFEIPLAVGEGALVGARADGADP